MTRKTIRVESRTWNSLPRVVAAWCLGQAWLRWMSAGQWLNRNSRACQQYPHELLARVLGPVGAFVQVCSPGCEPRRHRVGVRARCERPGRSARLGRPSASERPTSRSGPSARSSLAIRLAVAEEQGLGHTDLGVAARVRERRGERPGAVLRSPRSVSRIVRTGSRPAGWRDRGSPAGARSPVAWASGDARGRRRRATAWAARSPSQREPRA